MSQHPSLPTYTEFSTVLQTMGPQLHPAEVHGLLCGYLCGRVANDFPHLWKSLFAEIKPVQTVFDMLQQTYDASFSQLTEFSFDFKLLLPDDEENINARAEALGRWCQGLMRGLEQTGTSLQGPFGHEVKEALNDLTEIAKISSGDLVTNEEDEQAYIELVEYVRLSTVLIFQELNPKTITSSTVVH